MRDESIGKLTDEQRDNLRKLADYLDSGELKAEFNMGRFNDDRHWGQPTCGSVGCAVGHGPYAGIIRHEDEDWSDYAEIVFGVSDSRSWVWLFHSDWEDVDNTSEGAASRIRHYLEHGVPRNYTPWLYDEARVGY